MWFFEKYFQERGETFVEKLDGEISVRCPFEHDSGFDSRPSASINIDKEVFVCYTCMAEGRTSGYNEVGFYAKVMGVSNKEAKKFIESVETADGFDEQAWDTYVQNLQNNNAMLEYLFSRGITGATVAKYRLGYAGDGIMYPVFLMDVLCDIRTYRPNNTPKMVSRRGATTMLFPFDHWRKDDKPTLLVAGENDCLLARQFGFNALTTTGGEGNFPRWLMNYFKGKTIYICYDCDSAGRNGARRIAHLLREAGVIPYIVDLGLSGEKHDKDITDFFMSGNIAADLQALIEAAPIYSEELYKEDRNKAYPYVDLWNVGGSAYENRRLSTRVQFTGQFDQDFRVTTQAEWKCLQTDAECDLKGACMGCDLYKKDGVWELDDDNLRDLLYIVEQDESIQEKWLRNAIFPAKCPKGVVRRSGYSKIIKALLTADVDTEAIDGFQQTEQHAYIIGDELMHDGLRYRVNFKGCAHPKDGGRVYMIVDKAEPSDNALNTFKMTESIRKELSAAFHLETVTTSMLDRAARMKAIINMPDMNPHPMITYCIDLMYHSVLEFNYGDDGEYLIKKGNPEIIIVGDTRTGKTEALSKFQNFVGIGNYAVLKNASRARLLGGSEKMPNGSHKVKWGTVPRNHKGFLALDEMSGIDTDTMAALTDMRSSGVAKIEKMGGGQAPAKVRLLWISNPRTDRKGNSRPLSAYNYGADVIKELVGAEEDIARFDVMCLISHDMAENGEHNEWMEECDLKPHDRQTYRNLIYWAWSRRPDQVIWEDGMRKYITHMANDLNKRYNTSFSNFGKEAWTKIARLSVAVAAATFSASPDGECIVVTREHIDWVQNFLMECYFNDVFNHERYVYNKRLVTETNDATIAKVKALMTSNTNNAIIGQLVNSSDGCSLQQINFMSNREVIMDMAMNNLVDIDSGHVTATERLRKTVRTIEKTGGVARLTPLSQQ